MAAAVTPRRHPRDELRARRTGVRFEAYLPGPLAKLIEETRVKYGLTRKEIAIAAFTGYFANGAQQHDLKEVLRLTRVWLTRQVGSSGG